MKQFSLIAVHGNGGGAFRFAPLLPFIPEQINFHAVTLPGFGRIPLDPAIQTLSHYGDWLQQYIVALPRPRVLLGTGIGGTFAIDVVQRYANDIDALILHAPVGTRLEKRWFPRLMRLPGMTEAGRRILSAEALRPISERLLFRGSIPPQHLDAFYNGYRDCAAFGRMFDIITPDWFATLQPQQMPTALLWGELERVLTLDQLADYKRLFPNHLVHTEPNWDHFPTLEQPSAFVHTIATLSAQLLAK